MVCFLARTFYENKVWGNAEREETLWKEPAFNVCKHIKLAEPLT